MFPLSPPGNPVAPASKARGVALAGFTAAARAAANFLMREAGYADPQPIEPEDERARLEREFIEAAKGVQAIAARLTRLKEAA